MKINEFCERLYDKKDQQPSKSVGVSKEMREFIASELARANEEALRLKQDEIERQKDRFIPYHPISCDESCRNVKIIEVSSRITPTNNICSFMDGRV